ncbi:hypothetical protein MRX96_031000 [Rhipicephalus microplus]
MTSSTTILSRCAVTAAVRKETQEVRTFVSVMKGHFTPHLPLARPVSAPQKEWHSSTQVQQPTGPTIPLVLPVALAVLDDATISTAQPAALPAVTSAPVALPAATSAPVTQPSCIRDSCSCGPTSSRSGHADHYQSAPHPESRGETLPLNHSPGALLRCPQLQRTSSFLDYSGDSTSSLEKCKNALCLVPGHRIEKPRMAIYVRSSLTHTVVPVSSIVAGTLEYCAVTIRLGNVDTTVASV